MNRTFFLWLIGLLLAGPLAPAHRWFDLPELSPPDEFGDVLIDRISTANGQRPVAFSHWSHRVRYTCRVCHLELEFEMEVNGTEISEEKSRNGSFCGACHNGETAFGHSEDNCRKCHRGKTGGERQRFKALKAKLPPAPYGNEIDWVKAVSSGSIRPRQSILDDSFAPIPFTKRLKLEARWMGIPAAYFPHAEHQQWLDCADCHPDVFNVKKKTTEHFEMRYILEGKFCGGCHLRVAFPLDDCKKCHPDIRQ